MPTTLLYFREVAENRGGDMNLAFDVTYVRTFMAQLSDGLGGPELVYALCPVPSPGDVYVAPNGTVDSTAYCKDLKFEQQKSPDIWKITAQYSSDVDLWNPSGKPLLMPPIFKWGTKTITKPLELANDDKTPIRNTAGEPYDPPPEVEDSWATLSVQKNWPDWDPTVSLLFGNRLNSLPWLGFPAGEVRCLGITADSGYDKGKLYWTYNYSFEIKTGRGPDPWAYRILDRGYFSKDATTGKLTRLRDRLGQPLTKAALLDGKGQMLPTSGTPVYNVWHVYKYNDFNLLGLT